MSIGFAYVWFYKGLALKFKGFGFMLTGKLLSIFPLYLKKIFSYILLRRVFLV